MRLEFKVRVMKGPKFWLQFRIQAWTCSEKGVCF